MISCRVLGPIEVAVGGAPAPAELLWRKNLALLVYLARSPKRSRTREHLVGLLWGEKPESAARHSLNESLRTLRQYLQEDGLMTDGGQIRVAEDAVRLDIERLDRLIAEESWGDAAKLVAGDFMEGFGVPGCSDLEDWLHAERVAWRQRSIEVLASRADQLLTSGDSGAAAAVARRAVSLDPTSAMAQRAALRSLSLAGNRAGALASYEAFVQRLDEELAIEPDDETQELAERIRSGRSWRLPEKVARREDVGAESRRAPLIGRETELAELLEAWRICREDQRAVLALIEGDPGTGKTRLASEVVARARLDGATVVAARAVEADMSAPWSGFLALARGGLIDALGDRSSKWAERLALGVQDEPEPQLGSALTEVLREVSSEGAVVLYLDDAQWLDRESLLALGALQRDLQGVPLFVLTVTCPHLPRAELEEQRARIGREVAGVSVTLKALSTDALRHLARWALPTYDDIELDRVTRRVATDSAGLPLLAVELFHAVALGLDLMAQPGAWPEPMRTLDQTLPGGLPDAVTAAVRVGFRRLSPEAQTALAAAAVLDERVSEETIGRAAGLEREPLAAALDELEWQRWITAEPRGYSFVARIVRDVVGRDMLTAGQRKRIVQMAGQV